MARNRFELRPPWNLLLAALAFVALDALVFKTGPYRRFTSPSSASGRVDLFIRHEVTRRRPPGLDEALVIGDSGVGEAVMPALAEAAHPDATLRLIKAGLPDLSPRATYYVLRAIDPDRRRYRQVVVPLHFYAASADDDTIDDDGRDIDLLAPFARTGDYLDFAFALPDAAAWTRALAHGLFGCAYYAPDFRLLLSDPRQRLAEVDWGERNGDRLGYAYAGQAGSLVGLTYDRRTGAVHLPDGLSDERRRYIADHYRRPPRAWLLAKAASSARYQREWLGRIVDYYRGSGTVVVFLRMPSSPTPLPSIDPLEGAPSVVEPFAREGHVAILDAGAFAFLEQPRYFYNVRHLNTDGDAEFSKKLLELLLEVRAARGGERR